MSHDLIHTVKTSVLHGYRNVFRKTIKKNISDDAELQVFMDSLGSLSRETSLSFIFPHIFKFVVSLKQKINTFTV